MELPWMRISYTLQESIKRFRIFVPYIGTILNDLCHMNIID